MCAHAVLFIRIGPVLSTLTGRARYIVKRGILAAEKILITERRHDTQPASEETVSI